MEEAPHPQNLSITAMEMGHQKFWVSKRVSQGAPSTRHNLPVQEHQPPSRNLPEARLDRKPGLPEMDPGCCAVHPDSGNPAQDERPGSG